MDTTYKTILPRNSENAPNHNQTVPSRAKSSAKRTLISCACLNCRKTRTRCGGQKPKCESCAANGLECVYLPTLKEANVILKEQYNALSTRHESLGAEHASLCAENKMLRELCTTLAHDDDAHNRGWLVEVSPVRNEEWTGSLFSSLGYHRMGVDGFEYRRADGTTRARIFLLGYNESV